MNSAKKVDLIIADLKAKGTPKVEAVIQTAEACVGWPYVWGAIGIACTVANRTDENGKKWWEKDE